MEKRIIFRQIMLVVLAGCSNGNIVHKMHEKKEEAPKNHNSDFSFRALNSGWNNVAIGSVTGNTTSTNDRPLFVSIGHGSTLRNMNLGAMSSNNAAYTATYSMSDNPNSKPSSNSSTTFGGGSNEAAQEKDKRAVTLYCKRP